MGRDEAYMLSSVVVDLKISEVVDKPNWIVSAYLPQKIFLEIRETRSSTLIPLFTSLDSVVFLDAFLAPFR